MSSPLEIPIQARIIVVSKNEEFYGVKNLDKFEGSPS